MGHVRRFTVALAAAVCCCCAKAVELSRCRIVVDKADAPLVNKVAAVLGSDIERVTGVRPAVASAADGLPAIIVATASHLSGLAPDVDASDICGAWERFKVMTRGNRLIIVGSDPRGTAYGALHVSERIGVSPWYWWADLPVRKQEKLDYCENYVSRQPAVKYRGFFINDEDWGLKTWAAENYERDLGDIGPKTYDRVCELILRLKGNMLAPAMHDCTGAFYSHPESQAAADAWGIMITTSHCEPMLFNNAAKSEWDNSRDGEWNYLTNKQTILRKFDDRLRSTAQFDNIYTTGMRGLHDEAMKGSNDPAVRARTLEQVFADQRQILEKYKGRKAETIPQIFVPYKETLDIYDAGLRVPDDITIVWPDDNYGYMKRVSNSAERQRAGASGVYYHLSYLGTPHDYLWLNTTAPLLMYEELRKAYRTGGDRYWLLNVGDIKPMELGIQMFFDMAWNMDVFSYGNANAYQPQWLADQFGARYAEAFQRLLDGYYRLAWQRKPEYMGYELEWDSRENNRRHDSDFSFADGTAQQRLADYQRLADLADSIERTLPPDLQPAFFEMVGYAVKSASQINRQYLMAQRNHESGSQADARAATAAHDSIQSLLRIYNTMLGGKWRQMISCVPPGYTAKYHEAPELTDTPTTAYRLPADQRRPRLSRKIDLGSVRARPPFRLLRGIGTDWTALQMGEPLDNVQDAGSLSSDHVSIEFEADAADSLRVSISVVPMWPVTRDRSNRFGVSLDGSKPQVCENRFEEWGYSWKLQVLENRKDFLLTFPADRNKRRHRLSLIIGDPGQVVQQISWEPK